MRAVRGTLMDLAGAGLPVALGPWQFRLLALR